MKLTGTSYTVLGMVAAGVATGYEIARYIEVSTRFFWAASEGQIYPELKRLGEAGYLTARSEPSGRRPRIVYSLTDSGRAALHAWLVGDGPLKLELRDEGLLKLFLADDLTVADARDLLARMRGLRERALVLLESVEEGARRRPASWVALRMGVAQYRATAAWLAGLEAGLEGADDDAAAIPLLVAAAGD